MEHTVNGSYNDEGKHWDVELSGEFDIFNSNELKTSLTEFTKEKNADLHLNCSKLTFLDSTALGSLVAVLKNVKSYEGRIIIKNLKPNLYRLFKITNLDRVFEIVGDTNGK